MSKQNSQSLIENFIDDKIYKTQMRREDSNLNSKEGLDISKDQYSTTVKREAKGDIYYEDQQKYLRYLNNVDFNKEKVNKLESQARNELFQAHSQFHSMIGN